MPEPTPEMQAVHARVDHRSRTRARGGRWWMRRVTDKPESEGVISREELERIYDKAEQKEQQ